MKNPFHRNSGFTLLILLTSLVLSQFALAAQIQLVWDPNTELDLKGYNVYYGTASGTYLPPKNVGNVTSYALIGLTKGQTYFITIKAYDLYNNESDPSNEVSGPAIDRPGVVTQVSPSGTGTDTTPIYRWNAVSEASWYYLYVNDSIGNKVQKWYSAVEAGCPNGTGTCSVTPTTEVLGSSNWWIQSSNSAGYGPWSSAKSFNVSPPVAALLSTVTPDTTTPTYTWNAVSNATWYRLWVNDSISNRIQQWYPAADLGCPDGTGTCSVTPTLDVGGSSQWWIQSSNSAGYGPWSSPGSFTAPNPPAPLAATPKLPSGTITDSTPIYTWNPVPGATWYQLYVNDSIGNRIQQWYAASEAGCPDGTATCSVTSTLDVVGSSQWWVQTYNRAGSGPWSSPGSFTAPNPPAPLAATPGSPSGQTTDTTPTYTWNAVPRATWYQLYVNDSQGNKIQQWYSAADAGCPDGTGTCSVTPTVELGIGPCQWWIQTYNRVGLGPWSGGKSFTFPPPPTAVTQTWPSGTITDSTPAYIWNAVSGATWYQLYVNDSTGIKIQKWFTASEVGCETGTGTCSVKPTTALGAGAGQWWVQTYNSGGFGPWSLPGRSFTVSPPG